MQLEGSFTKPEKQGLSRTFRHVGASSAWSLGLFLFFFYILAVLSFLTDAVRLNNFNPLWFVISGAGFLPPLAIGIIYRWAFLERRPEKSRPILNLLVAGLAGSSRNVSVGLFAFWSGLDTTSLWSFRFFGGFIMGVGIYLIWAVGDGSKIEYLTSLKEFGETQSRLSEARLQMPRQISAINESLQERTKSALLPQLNVIRNLLTGSETTSQALETLRFTITEQIRPMMVELSNQKPEPFEVKNLRKLRKVAPSLPSRFVLRDKLQVAWASVIELFGISLWLIFFGSPNGLLDMVAMYFVYFVVLSFCKLLLPKTMPSPKNVAYATTSLFALIASSANVIYIYFVLKYDEAQFFMLAGFALLCGILGPLLLLQLTTRVEKRKEIESQISEDLLALAKENALFAQKLWVFRKRWLLVLHGSVQSSLTAALTRLQNAPTVDAVLLERVKQDLVRAEAAIGVNLHETVNLETGFKELNQVWSGICEIEFQVSERARRALARSQDSSFCVNEIVKEAISNAVRHGDATSAKVILDRTSDDILHIEVQNNGHAPSKQNKLSKQAGIGSEMMDETCLYWNLDSVNGGVTLTAEMPVKL